ncbi:eukaryotic translation initiation factor 2A [Brachionus plicatilis]|uniref:Eukaryotic translation initiation factor 2A n=1 Tax=Brachionus plicatilis TaxID=10195 RepID=A0A3M7QB63_BRAPC|nr:eukaryotic translation initiation factor 2A [Brachionus plicatilis]
MASMTQSSPNPPIISVRSSEGLFLLSPNDNNYNQIAKFNNFHDESKNCRISAFDPTGKYFAYCNSIKCRVIDLQDDCKVVVEIERPRTSYLKFSPRGNYLITWETFHISKDNQKESANLNIIELESGNAIKSIIQKKQLEMFVEWTDDEKTFALINNGELLFFSTASPETVVNRIKMENLKDFSFNSASKCVAVYVSGKKSEPSFIRLFKYPDLSNAISNKSFFNADRVDFKWNKSGTNLLLLCSTETSQNSYYGDSTLHQINTNGESQLVQLSKKGPIYALSWNPVRDEFVVVYGTMPAKVTLFNGKSEAIYDFGTGPRNECFFSHQGNLLCLAGFGNLRGRIEVWNLSSNSRAPQELSSFQADDTTYFEWSPDGEHMLTATTAPRLRVSNGFKIWNYSGEILYNHPMSGSNELWQVQWQQGNYPTKPIAKKTSQPVIKQETKAYVPPHLRGTNKPSQIVNKLHQDDEKPDKDLKIKPTGKSSDDPEKQIKNLRKKLSQIEDLRKKQASGVKLEVNQLDKIKREDEVIAELKKLGAI